MNKNIRKISVAGALSALVLLLGFSKLGIIPWFSGASITILHLPVIIGALVEGPVVGGIVGAVFGIYSLVMAATSPAGALDPFFVNPLVSVLPRILIAVVAWAVYAGFCKIEKLPKIVGCAIASFLGSLTNTVLVLGTLVLIPECPLTFEVALAVVVGNGILEAVAATIISTAVVSAWKHISGRKTSKLTEETADEE